MEKESDNEPRRGEGIERRREPHCVPLGSIFVWTVELVALSVIYLCYTVAMQSLFGSSSSNGRVNVADISTSSLLLASGLITMISHIAIANALNRKELAGWAGGCVRGPPCVRGRPSGG